MSVGGDSERPPTYRRETRVEAGSPCGRIWPMARQPHRARTTRRSIFYWEPEEDRPHKVEQGSEEDEFDFRCRYCKAYAGSPEVRNGTPCLSDEEKRIFDEQKRRVDESIERIRAAKQRNEQRLERLRNLRIGRGACLACAEFHTSDRCDGSCERCGDTPCSCRY